MAQQFIDIGNTANDGSGTPIRDAFEICNDNFSELYSIGGISGIANGTSNIQIIQDSTINMATANVPNVLVVQSTGITVQGTLLANTAISATGNITAGGFFQGNGSLLTGVVSQANAALLTGSVLSSNVTTSTLTSVGTLSVLTVTGNITGGNVNTSGRVSASGNIDAQNFNAGSSVSAAGNVSGDNLIAGEDVLVTGNVSATGNVLGNFFIGNGSLLTGVSVSSNAALLTGTILSANVVSSSLRSVGNLDVLVVSNALGGSGNVSANNVTAVASISAGGNITGANVVSNDQITTVGFSATGNVTGANVNATGLVSAIGNVRGGNIVSPGAVSAGGSITGANFTTTGNSDGGNLNVTGIATVTGNITGGNLITTGLVSAQGNVSSGNLLSSGTITSIGNITAPYFLGNVVGNITGNIAVGGNNTEILFNDGGLANASSGFTFDKTSNLVTISGNVAAANVTTTGTVSASTVTASGNILNTGNVSVGNNLVVAANAFIGGDLAYINVSTLAIEDPIPALGRGANNASLGSDDGFDRGIQMYYYDTAERSAFIGYDNNTNKLIMALNVNITNEVVTVANYGNIVAGNIEAQTLVSTGNVSTSGVFSGNGSALTNLPAANIVGTVATASSATTAGTVTTAAQSNITSVGTLTQLAVSGNISMTATSGSFLKLPSATSDPAGASDGSIYYNSSTGNLRKRTGGVWSNLS